MLGRLIFVYLAPQARHHSKCATHISSLNPHRGMEVNTDIKSTLQMRKLAGQVASGHTALSVCVPSLQHYFACPHKKKNL